MVAAAATTVFIATAWDSRRQELLVGAFEPMIDALALGLGTEIMGIGYEHQAFAVMRWKTTFGS
jgi:hypothetical protein